MKTLHGLNHTSVFMKRLQGLSFVLLITFLLSSCGDGQRRANRIYEEQLKEAKQDTEQSIKEVKINVQERIDYLDEQIEEASGELQEELKDARSELKDELEKLDKELEKVKKATLENWDKVIGSVTETVYKSREKTNKVSKKVRELLD